MPTERKKISKQVRLDVLTESGFRCAVPTCRQILALDMHHLYQVSDGGGDEASNLISLCPTCHAMHHRGTIPAESLYVYKLMLVSLTRAFDVDTIDRLLFLDACKEENLVVSGDGLLQFARLVAAGLANFELNANNNGLLVTYKIVLSLKGRHLIDAWRKGDRSVLRSVLSGDLGNELTP